MFVFIIKYCRRKGISYIMTLYCRYLYQPHCLGCKACVACRRRFAKNRSNTNHLNPSSLYYIEYYSRAINFVRTSLKQYTRNLSRNTIILYLRCMYCNIIESLKRKNLYVQTPDSRESIKFVMFDSHY